MFYTVYKITNWYNGKIYIGIHKTNNLDDGYMGSGKHLKHAQEKYGIQYFTKEYLEIFDNPDDMYEMESVLVNEEFVKRGDTYNLKEGGFGGFDFINKNGINNSTKTLEQLRRGGLATKKRLESDPIFRKTFCDNCSRIMKERHLNGVFNDETIKKVLETKRKNGSLCHSEETKRKISEKSKERLKNPENNPQYGKVRCVPINATTCVGHIGYFPDQIPEGWITTKEWKLRKKEIKQQKEFDKKKKDAYYWYNKFIECDCESLGDFVRESDYPYSLQNLINMFRRYVVEFKTIPGQSYKRFV